MSIFVSRAKAARYHKARRREEQDWQRQNGPVTVYRMDDLTTPAFVIPPRETAPTCDCGSLRTFHTGTKYHRFWSGWFCPKGKCEPVWEHNRAP